MKESNVLIADSGATKTDWCLLHQGEIAHRFITKGISPIFQTEEEIAAEIKKQVYTLLKEKKPEAVFFYGAGCIPEKTKSVKSAIQTTFSIDKVEVYSDLIAAAHSLCGNKPGIACILGTGSNSCEWDGTKITKQVAPLGFILGDEGSGASMGKLLVGDVLKNQLSTEIKDKFLNQYNLTHASIIDNVYRKPFPSRFLASISPFLLENLEEEAIASIVKKSFHHFFKRNVLQYNYKKYEVNFIGSIAYHYSTTLKEIAQENNVIIGKISKSPLKGLIKYYNSKTF